MAEAQTLHEEGTDIEEDELDLSAVAQLLSELSQPGRLPKGASPREEPTPFEADEVSFDDNEWLAQLRGVQPWLCLDQPMPSGSTAARLAELLFSQISPDPADACVAVIDEGRVRLTDLGTQHLETRLTRAVEHKSAFLEMLEAERSFADASEDWRLYWEDADSQSGQAVAIKANVQTWSIKYFRDLAQQGDLDLNPSYQRDVVWSNSESQLLIESILRGIPLPSVILTESEDGKHQIVDGKQRLTAILRFIGHHPSGRRLAATLEGGTEALDTDFRRFARRNQLKPRDIAEGFLPFKLKKYPPGDPLHPVSGKYYYEIRDTSIRIGDEESTLSVIFERMNKRYEIPVIVYTKTSLRDIHHVFWLYNKQGKKLNAEELRNAVYHHLDLTRLLLVVSGDRPEPALLAPYLPDEVTGRLEEVAGVLVGRGFGTTRFKRTKVLSWVTAILLKSPRELRAGVLATPSTANHINSLLDELNDDGNAHRLFQRPTLVSFARHLQDAVLLHEETDAAWHPRFRTKKNQQGMASKWEELPLVGSLIACFVLVTTGNQDVLRARRAHVRRITQELRGPDSTQNKTQWAHIAKVVMTVLDALDLDHAAASQALEASYGHSCLGSLRRLVAEQA